MSRALRLGSLAASAAALALVGAIGVGCRGEEPRSGEVPAAPDADPRGERARPRPPKRSLEAAHSRAAPSGARPRSEPAQDAPRAEPTSRGARLILPAPPGAVVVTQRAPGMVRVGEPFVLFVDVQNAGSEPLHGVTLAPSPENEVEFLGLADEGHAQGVGETEPARWTLGVLAPGELRVVPLRAVARRPGRAEACLAVSFEPTLSIPVRVAPGPRE